MKAKLMKNPNDISAHLYDIANQPLKNDNVTNEELALIKSLVPKGSRILDIGCGTGRHSILLANDGYQVTGIDSSRGMLDELKKKSKKVSLINSDIYSIHNRLDRLNRLDRFNLIILMWNAFNEIALTKKLALRLLELFNKYLSPAGKILINSNNPETFEPANLHYITNWLANNKEYIVHWDTVKYYKQTNSAVSRELIDVIDSNGKKFEQTCAYIKQRWWSLEEYRRLIQKAGFNLKLKKLLCNEEFYIILSK